MATESFEAHDNIEATFTPKRMDTLRPEARPFIGRRLRFHAAWVVGEEEGGPYVGQWVFLPDGRQFGWVPEEDLTDIEPV